MLGRMSADELSAGLIEAGFRGELMAECPLAPLTTWRIGGPAELLATPADLEDPGSGRRWAVERDLGWRILGNGSNLLVRDEGVRGLVLRRTQGSRRHVDCAMAGIGFAREPAYRVPGTLRVRAAALRPGRGSSSGPGSPGRSAARS